MTESVNTDEGSFKSENQFFTDSTISDDGRINETYQT